MIDILLVVGTLLLAGILGSAIVLVLLNGSDK